MQAKYEMQMERFRRNIERMRTEDRSQMVNNLKAAASIFVNTASKYSPPDMKRNIDPIRYEDGYMTVSGDKSRTGLQGTLTQATEWDSSTAYSRLAIVTYLGSCYQVIGNSVPAGTLPTDTTNFIKLAGTVALASLTINVGPTRSYTTISAAYDYIKTINIGNGGTIKLILDAGTFAGGTFKGVYCNLELEGASSSTTIFGSDLNFTNCASVTLSKLKLLKLTCSGSKVIGSDVVVDASGYTFSVSAITASDTANLSFTNLTVIGNTTYLKGIYSQGGSVVMLYSGITIQGCSIALYCDLDGFIYDSVAGSTLTGNTTDCSPAENTYGNYHSYICRL